MTSGNYARRYSAATWADTGMGVRTTTPEMTPSIVQPSASPASGAEPSPDGRGVHDLASPHNLI
jgi:hypothetical protein